nr:immunoglobulin heavy chain junction region [Mus musculus]
CARGGLWPHWYFDVW